MADEVQRALTNLGLGAVAGDVRQAIEDDQPVPFITDFMVTALARYERAMREHHEHARFMIAWGLDGRMPTNAEWAYGRWASWYRDIWPWSWARPRRLRLRALRIEMTERIRHCKEVLRNGVPDPW